MSIRHTPIEGSTPKMSIPRRRLGRRMSRTAAGVLGTVAAALAFAAPVHAAGLEFTSFEAKFVDLDGNGAEVEATQAGSHPDYLDILFGITTQPNASGSPIPLESIKDVDVELPPGIVGNPEATPRCTMVDFGADRCPAQTVVGVTDVTYNVGRGGETVFTAGLYNVTPPKGVVARLVFRLVAVDTVMDIKVNSDGRYTIETNVKNVSQLVSVYKMHLRLFGVPSDMNGRDPNTGALGGPGTGARIPFLTLPSRCGPAGAVKIRANSWNVPAVWGEASDELAPLTGCADAGFDAGLALQPQTPRAGVPAGAEVTLKVAQNADPDGLATPPVKRVTTTLPEGMVVSPSNADGLVGCTDEQAAVRSLAAPTCPTASRIGSVQIDTPVLPGPLTGAIFLGQPKSMKAASGEMLRLFLVAEGSGVTIKQEGRITPDPVTGRLTAVFDDAPELPFSEMKLVFNDGPKAPLTNPRLCGTYTTSTEVVSSAGSTSSSTSRFDITQNATGGGCAPLGFAPSFVAGTANATAGAASALTLAFGRTDGEQDLGDLAVDLPAGLMGMVSQAEPCPDGAAAAGTCDETSRIGSVDVAAGPGTNPFQLPGRGVYLTGPYKGAPYGLSIVVPAIAGPFNLGTVVVRAAILIDRKTAALKVVSDPMPTILEGIPLRLRQVKVTIDKPGFMVNPTSCSAKGIGGTLTSAEGVVARVASRFQVGNCSALAFDPALALRLGAARSTFAAAKTPAEMVDAGHPALSARLAIGSGRANIAKAAVTLPESLALDPDNANGLCEPVDAARDTCPAASIVGSVRVVTPVLKGTVDGPVYFVRGERVDPKSGRVIKTLPKLFVPLTSSVNPLVKIDLRANSQVDDDSGRLITTFEEVPDVPISSFELNLIGGKHGILVVSSANVCAKAQYADNVFTGQNGKRYISRTGVAAACPLSIVKSGHSATALKLTVGGLEPGTVTVTGKGLSKTSKKIAVAGPRLDGEGRASTMVTTSATTHADVAAKLSKAVRRSLARGRDVKVKVTVAFTAQGATKATKATKTLTIHGAKKKK
jgi:hypothetical protein